MVLFEVDLDYRQTLNRSITTINSKDTAATNQNTGDGQTYNNMPPYMAVYMWKLTA